MRIVRRGLYTLRDLKRLNLSYQLCTKHAGYHILLISKREREFDHLPPMFRVEVQTDKNVHHEAMQAVSRGKMPDYNQRHVYEDVVLTKSDKALADGERYEVYEVM